MSDVVMFDGSCEDCDVDPQEFDWPDPGVTYHVPSFLADVPLGAALCLRCRQVVWLAAWLNDEVCPAAAGSVNATPGTRSVPR